MSTNFVLSRKQNNYAASLALDDYPDNRKSQFHHHQQPPQQQSQQQYRASNLKREPLFFFIMRLNLKAVLLFLTVAVIIITCGVYMRCADFTKELVKRWDHPLYDTSSNILSVSDNNNDNVNNNMNSIGSLQNIDCNINQEYTIQCKRDLETNEVYVPFTFLHNYFDITGSITNAHLSNSPSSAASFLAGVGGVGGGGGGEFANNELNSKNVKFNWMHSVAKVNYPKGKYDSKDLFMYFENYNVEVRDRVKCISGIEGVPVSIQWEKKGYFYPTQIAQFGLSHYSKNRSEPEPKIKVLEDGDLNLGDWLTPKSSNLTRLWHPKFNTSVLQFETAIEFESALSLWVNQTYELVLSLDLLLVTNSSSLMVTVQNRETKHIYRLHYIPADILLSIQETNIYYGLGTNVSLNKWRHLTRDIHIDIQKGLTAAVERKSQAIKVKRNELKIVSISFLGLGFFDNVTLSTSDHLAHFYDAAEWFVNNQNLKTGGWPNPVKRSLNGFVELKAGWLSAMGQGHAISVLSRAYWHSGGDQRYLKAAALALKPFRVLSKDGGVLAKFMDKYFWYEEYPTTPPSFVLNGFIYSLLGLYDLNSTAPANIAREANKLFNDGMLSLKKMLLLYDTGSGSIYDLRHLSLGVAPNLARWDYHATHVNQLLLLATIDNDPFIIKTAERWKSYMFDI